MHEPGGMRRSTDSETGRFLVPSSSISTTGCLPVFVLYSSIAAVKEILLFSLIFIRDSGTSLSYRGKRELSAGRGENKEALLIPIQVPPDYDTDTRH